MSIIDLFWKKFAQRSKDVRYIVDNQGQLEIEIASPEYPPEQFLAGPFKSPEEARRKLVEIGMSEEWKDKKKQRTMIPEKPEERPGGLAIPVTRWIANKIKQTAKTSNDFATGQYLYDAIVYAEADAPTLMDLTYFVEGLEGELSPGFNSLVNEVLKDPKAVLDKYIDEYRQEKGKEG